MKISLCFHHLEQQAEFPDLTYFPLGKHGHNIQPLLDKLVSEAYTADFESQFTYVKQDRVFLKSKPFRAYLIALSDFGVSSRYFHLNTVLAKRLTSILQSKLGRMSKQSSRLQFRFKDAFYASDGSQEILLKVLAESRGILVRCGRALAQLLVLGALGLEQA